LLIGIWRDGRLVIILAVRTLSRKGDLIDARLGIRVRNQESLWK